MPIGTLLLGLALLIIVSVIIVLPLLDRARPAVRAPSQREALTAEKQVTLREIRELDFDHRTHKLNDDDYKRLREVQVQRGARVLRELSLLAVHDAGGDKSLLGTNADGAVDAVADANHIETADEVDLAIERRITALRQAHSSGNTQACPACGHTASAADKFCPECGAKLTTPLTKDPERPNNG